jgi:predicted secreted protein with PEFG-CTERM motif
MDSKIIYGIISLLIISTGTVYAQESLPIVSVQTDDNTYYEGDSVVISGKVNAVIGNTPVMLQIFTGNGDLVNIAQINIAQDDTFSHSIPAKGPLWQKQGEYSVKASYGQNGISESKFNYIPNSELNPTNFKVDTGNEKFDVRYIIKGGTVKNITTDSDNFTLKVQINSTDDGEILLELPREFIGAEKQNGNDEIFIILIDEIQVPYDESITNSESRTIKIEFNQNDSNIEIIGTFVVPEFGTIAAMILAVAIISIIAISSKSRLSIIPRY